MSNKTIVKKLEEKILASDCENCSCGDGCKKEELSKSIINKIKILKGNKTILK